jgi:hypothetical protein
MEALVGRLGACLFNSAFRGRVHALDVKMPKPVTLNDGRKVSNLADARELMLALPERHPRNAPGNMPANSFSEPPIAVRNTP